MVEHEFGGDWTELKLLALKKYLNAYRKIFTENEKARYFKTIYVDAFAGTGERKVPNGSLREQDLFAQEELHEVQGYEKGSVKIALDLASPFDEYIFIDKKRDHTDQLSSIIKSDYPHLESKCRVWKGDGPEILDELCWMKKWDKQRAVVFLDPYGMNVEWELLRKIAKTEAIDLWFLFPLGTGVNRLLKRDAMPPKAFSDKLTRIFGTEEWKTEFYKEQSQHDLFGDEQAGHVKNATFEQIGNFLIKRLQTIFAGVAPTTKALYNSRNNPMYLLCFAAGNKKGAPTAIKIADFLLGQ